MSSHPPRSVNIQIPSPCSEDWNKMTPEDKGRHCASCAKIVTDFTTMSDQQLIDYLAAGEGSGCGRVRPDQLDRVILRPTPTHLWKFPRVVLARTLSLFTTVASAVTTLDAKAHSPIIETEIVHGGLRVDFPLEHIYVIGTVTSNGAPIPGVKVSIPAFGVDTITNDSGDFELRIPGNFHWMEEYIVFEHPAYVTKSIQMLGANYPLQVALESAVCEITEFAPEAQYMVSGAMVSVLGGYAYEEPSWGKRQWWKLKRLFSIRRFRGQD